MDLTEAAVSDTFSVRLPAERPSVTEGRHLLSAFLHRTGFPEAYDVCLATTEALSNVVRHAYPDDEHGDIEVEAVYGSDGLRVTVRDFGFGPTARLASESLGLGLALMASVAHRVVVDIVPGKGTEVHLTFRCDTL